MDWLFEFRVTGVPKWVTNCTGMVGNHNWVETYNPDTGYWSFTDAYGYGYKVMNYSWFYPKDTSCAIPGNINHSIWTTSYQTTGKYFPMAWDWDATYVNGIDVTLDYQS